jgi:hypothetical protein
MSQNKLLRKIFGLTGGKVTAHILFKRLNRGTGWTTYVARIGEVINVKPEGKITLGRLMRKWEDNIKMYLKEINCENRDKGYHFIQASGLYIFSIKIINPHNPYIIHDLVLFVIFYTSAILIRNVLDFSYGQI